MQEIHIKYDTSKRKKEGKGHNSINHKHSAVWLSYIPGNGYFEQAKPRETMAQYRALYNDGKINFSGKHDRV